jgi:cytosine/uracil/thiamine/allantoin permease
MQSLLREYSLNMPLKSWWEAWICVIRGHFIAAIPMVLAGRPGATYHIPFPVIARASFGVWGSSWPILNRNTMYVRQSQSLCGTFN